jgi:hypothetical protein
VLFLVGLAVYVAALIWILTADLVDLSGIGPVLVALNVISIALTLFGFGWSLVYDLRRLRREEEDIQFLLDAGPRDPDALHKVLWPEVDGTRRRTGETRVETLLDDLAMQVEQLAPGRGGRVPAASELRALAVSRTAPLGSCARYVSQLLLLMTVLGTFVGVKEALPDLVCSLNTRADSASARQAGGRDAACPPLAVPAPRDSVATSPSQARGFDETRLRKALRQVADAFGSNLGALLGSITLGLVAFGLGSGRQNLLARLEHVSILYVYPLLASASDESALAQAVAKLADASDSLERIAQISGELGDLRATLRQMSEETREALAGVLQEQRQQVLSDSQQRVDRLGQQLTDLAVAVQQSVLLYDGLAAATSERSEILAHALDEVRASATELRGARVDYGRYVEESTQEVRAQLTALDTTFAAVRASVEGAATASGAIRQELGAARDDVGTLIGRADAVARALGEAEARQRQAAAEFERAQREAQAELVRRQLEADAGVERRQREALDRLEGSLMAAVAERLARPVAALNDSVNALPARAQAGVLAAFQEAREHRIGGGADDLSASLERVARLIERLDRPADQLVAALQRLSTRIDRLESRTREPLLRRMMDRIRRRGPSADSPRPPEGPSTRASHDQRHTPASTPSGPPVRDHGWPPGDDGFRGYDGMRDYDTFRSPDREPGPPLSFAPRDPARGGDLAAPGAEADAPRGEEPPPSPDPGTGPGAEPAADGSEADRPQGSDDPVRVAEPVVARGGVDAEGDAGAAPPRPAEAAATVDAGDEPTTGGADAASAEDAVTPEAAPGGVDAENDAGAALRPAEVSATVEAGDEPTTGEADAASGEDAAEPPAPPAGGDAAPAGQPGPGDPGTLLVEPAPVEEALDPRIRRVAAELTQDGRFEPCPAEVDRPMAEVRWIPGESRAEAFILSDFVFGLNSRRLELAFEVDEVGSGRYETVFPARVAWNDQNPSGTVLAKGQLRFRG